MARGFFITGTDTDVGKTTIALGLMAAFQQKGFTVAAMKPVSAGCVRTDAGLRNNDAVRLMQQASVELPYEIVNPYAFEPAIAPHIAAAQNNVEMSLDAINQAYQLIAAEVDIVIVEGAGGWLVPFNKTQTMADIARTLQLDVIQVVGLKLGCLNHALLTSESIAAQNLSQVAWAGNLLSGDMLYQAENIQTLQQWLPGKCLGIIPALQLAFENIIGTEDIAKYLHVDTLL